MPVSFAVSREVTCALHRSPARNNARRPDAESPRQSARRLRADAAVRRRRAAHRRHRSHFCVRLRAGFRHSRQGQGAHAAVGVLVRAHGRSRAAPSRVARRRSVPRGCAPARGHASRADDAGAADRADSCRVRRARLPVRVRMEGIPAERQRLRREAARGSPRIGSSAGTDLHACDEGGYGARHQHQRAGSGTARGCGPDCAAQGADAGNLSPRAASTRNRRASSSPTRNSNLAWSAPATPRPTSC